MIHTFQDPPWRPVGLMCVWPDHWAPCSFGAQNVPWDTSCNHPPPGWGPQAVWNCAVAKWCATYPHPLYYISRPNDNLWPGDRGCQSNNYSTRVYSGGCLTRTYKCSQKATWNLDHTETICNTHKNTYTAVTHVTFLERAPAVIWEQHHRPGTTASQHGPDKTLSCSQGHQWPVATAGWPGCVWGETRV